MSGYPDEWKPGILRWELQGLLGLFGALEFGELSLRCHIDGRFGGDWVIGIVKMAREWRLSPNSCIIDLTEETSTCIFE